MIERRIKQPAETCLWAPFAGSGGAVILSCAAQARGLVPGAAALFLPAETTVAFGRGQFLVGGGTDGETYLVTARARLADGSEVERELELTVIDAAWAMPDGGAPYLSIAEFVTRFGLAETIVMTDADGSGRIDRGYLIGALVAAQGAVEVNLAGRYALPLAVVPEAIKTAIGDIARNRLYPRGVPEGVAGLARAAERLLERFASGAVPLPVPALPPAEVSATPVLISKRGRRRYPNGLDD